MPGNLAAASPSGVLPNSTFTAFVESLSFPMLVESSYHDNTIERSLITDSVNTPVALRSWKLAKRITTSQLSSLLTFFTVTTLGGLKPFYAYPDPRQYDATGSSVVGRITCVFRGGWSQSLTPGRHDVPSLELLEIA